MVDIVDKKTRSRMMAGIKGRDTQPELLLRRSLYALGFRYRIHVGKLPGRPDMVFPKYHAVLFVHGCFWHRHTCRFATNPSSNNLFWEQKFQGTVERDAKSLAKLQEMNWRVGIIWECALKKQELAKISARVSDWLLSEKQFLEIP